MTPRLTLITAVSDPTRAHLWSCLESVRRQTCTDWQHVIVVGPSTARWVPRMLTRVAKADSRVRLVISDRRGGLASTLGDGLAAATGELVAVLDDGDVLEPDALEAMAAAIGHADADVAYSDHDVIDPDGVYVDPAYKPDFSPERLRAQDYMTPLVVARRAVVERVGGFRDGYDGAEHHDLLLRLTEQGAGVAHVPRILCHARRPPVPSGGQEAVAATVRAIGDHCRRVGIAATVEATAHDGCYRVLRRVEGRPLVSVVIPTRGSAGRVWGLERCFVVEAVRSLVSRSAYRELEFVIVYDTSTPTAVLDELTSITGAEIRLVSYDLPFNFAAKINLGVAHATAPLILMLNDDVELIDPSGIEVLVAHLQMPDVAMAGAKLLFADGTLQHGGHVYTGLPEHACFGWRGDSPGPEPLRPLAVERECSGVTAGCALVTRAAFDEVGGLPTDLPLNYNDADFSLKLRAAGYRIIWTPWSVWYHFEGRSRGRSVPLEAEVAWMRQHWEHELGSDPYYNPNLAPSRNDFLESPSARRALWREP